jgi:hypothetical protein
VSESEGKYSVELFKEGCEGAGQEEIIDRHDNLTVARAIYRGRVSQYPVAWSGCAIARAFWREAIGQRRCRKRVHFNAASGRSV